MMRKAICLNSEDVNMSSKPYGQRLEIITNRQSLVGTYTLHLTRTKIVTLSIYKESMTVTLTFIKLMKGFICLKEKAIRAFLPHQE